ncbi:hypothetical protein EB796_022625 [Bugula neritina]|uniref:Doublecortin domain-containing protein n=1 Tax=Bugula neritina TaxID=10212 RepID=A0A7J7IYX5_BUGNE|nr:hypothetical protein EB796_022625 [Bugula neritina]
MQSSANHDSCQLCSENMLKLSSLPFPHNRKPNSNMGHMMEGVQTSHNTVLAGSPTQKRNIYTQPVPKAMKAKSQKRPTTMHQPASKKEKNGSVKENLWGTDDLDDFYSPRRPANGIDFSRYEPSPQNDYDDSLDVPLLKNQPKKTSKRGKLVTFYKSGDKHFKGLSIAVNQKQFVKLEALLDFLSSKLPTTNGIKSIFSWPGGKPVYNVGDFLVGEIYVCSDTQRLDRSIDYGEIKPTVWHNKRMSAVKFRRDENELLQNRRDPQPVVAANAKPRVLTIISNVDRSSREKVMLNPLTNQTFEEILHDIGNMVTIEEPPVTGLFTEKRPHKKVFSFSQLFKDFKDHDCFLAVGRELVPVDSKQRRVPKSTQSDSAVTFKPAAKRVAVKRVAAKHFQKSVDDYDSDYEDIPSRANLSVPVGRPSLFSRMGQPAPRRFVKPPLSPKHDKVIRKPLKSYPSIRIDVHNQRREFYTPSNYQRPDGKKPDRKLQLEWVYGYRGRDARNNLYVLPSGEVLYYVASVAVLLDREKDRQRHYVGHNEDITW